jgi:hypothetical protein
MEYTQPKLSSAGTDRAASQLETSRRLSTVVGVERLHQVQSRSLNEADPNYAHLTVLDWMGKKFQLVRLSQDSRRTPDSNSVSVRRKPKETDPFMEKLKLEHRSNPSGRQVINLPKTPYGSHRPYNGDPQFMRNHIVDNQSEVEPEIAKELGNIDRKFKIVQKRSKAKHSVKRNDAPTKFRELEDHFEMPVRTGRLICPMNRNLLDCYENDKLKYEKVAATKAMAQTYREMQTGQYEHYISKPQSPKVSVQEVLNRLYQTPTGRRTATKRLESIELKYKGLFERSPKHRSLREMLSRQSKEVSLSVTFS